MSAFRSAVEARDPAAMEAALHPDATFHSPAVFKPYEGRDAVMFVLRGVLSVLEDFRYVAAYSSADGEVLRFTARAGSRSVEGVDLLTYDEAGLITDLTVMLRPLSALQEVAARMGAALGA